MLTPRELLKAEFKTVLRGYNPQQVDEFVKTVVAKYEELYQENQRLKQELEQERAKSDELRQNERRVDELIQLARQTAEDAREAAQREADAIVEEARVAAAREAEKVRLQLRDALDRLHDLERRERAVRRRLKALLHSLLDQVEREEAEEPYALAEAGGEDEADDVLAEWAGDAATAEEDDASTRHGTWETTLSSAP